MKAALRTLMEGLIDYAGLFPPASLAMDEAVRDYAVQAGSAEGDWLGRFVVPVTRLDEFALAAAEVRAEFRRDSLEAPSKWTLSALVGADIAGDLAAVEAFNRKAASLLLPEAIDSIEAKAESEDAIRAVMAALPRGSGGSGGGATGDRPQARTRAPTLAAYLEIPIHADPVPLLAAIAREGGRAKVRTGGVTPSLIPPSADLARFLEACAGAGVAFKATAGLHHPVRSPRRLTYAPDSPEAVMHGFLNVFLAAAFALQGMDRANLTRLLEERSPGAFVFTEDAVEWNGHRLEGGRIQEARSRFALAFGSCSFDEPRDELKEAGWL
jgi:hypothetical protein